jgi:calcineurin-like phosphoesterase family protein
MQNVWFIADTHFSHKNILGFEPTQRPFKTLEEHDETLIDNWNRVVKPDDIVWHLGDFCFGGKKNVEIAGRLAGRKRLVMGNHDCYGVELYAKHFERIFGAVHYKEFILTHIPIRKAYHPEMVNIHGHLHSKQIMLNDIPCSCVWKYPQAPHKLIYNEIKPDPGYVCVSVEQINLTPIHIDEIRKIVESTPV